MFKLFSKYLLLISLVLIGVFGQLQANGFVTSQNQQLLYSELNQDLAALYNSSDLNAKFISYGKEQDGESVLVIPEFNYELEEDEDEEESSVNKRLKNTENFSQITFTSGVSESYTRKKQRLFSYKHFDLKTSTWYILFQVYRL